MSKYIIAAFVFVFMQACTHKMDSKNREPQQVGTGGIGLYQIEPADNFEDRMESEFAQHLVGTTIETSGPTFQNNNVPINTMESAKVSFDKNKADFTLKTIRDFLQQQELSCSGADYNLRKKKWDSYNSTKSMRARNALDELDSKQSDILYFSEEINAQGKGIYKFKLFGNNYYGDFVFTTIQEGKAIISVTYNIGEVRYKIRNANTIPEPRLLVERYMGNMWMSNCQLK